MVRTAAVTLLLACLSYAAAPASAQSPPAAGALQGSWTMASLVVNGDPTAGDQVHAGRLVIEGDQYVQTFSATAVPARFRVDPSRSPRSIDFTYASGPQAGKTVKGIYDLAAETLTVCRGLTESDPRPSRFEAPADSGRLLVVWTRARPRSPEVLRALGALQGTWVMVSATNDGKSVAGEEARKVTVTILGSTHTVRIDGQVVAHDVALEVDPTTTPASTTETVLDGPGKGAVIRGIYRLEGDALTSCVAAAEHERPTAFDAGPGTGRALRVFRRVRDAHAPGARDGLEHLRFEGTWGFASVAVDGKPAPPGTFRDARLTLRGTRFVWLDAKGTFHGAYAVDADAAPKTIDVTFTDGPEAGHTLLGVYTLDGDDHRVCFAPAGKPRPRALDAPPGGGLMVNALKRLAPGS